MSIDEIFPKIEKKKDELREFMQNIKINIDNILKDYKVRLTFDEYEKLISTYVNQYVINVNIEALLNIAENITEK